jgi:hypothetical protein
VTAEPETIHAPPATPDWALSDPAETSAQVPQWPDKIAKPPGARWIAGAKLWRIQRGEHFICASPDPLLLAETFAAIEAGEADREPEWSETLGPRPSNATWSKGVFKVRRSRKVIAFARRPEDLVARLRAVGAPIVIPPKVMRPRGRPPSPPSFKVTGHVPTFNGIETHFRRAPEPTLSPSELAARLGIKVVELRDVEDLPHVRGRFKWREVCRHLRGLAAANKAPRWYDPDC